MDVIVWTGKTELFETTDVTVPFILLHIRACARFFGDHAKAFCLSACFHRSLNAELLSIIEFHYRISNFECHSVFMSKEIFSKRSCPGVDVACVHFLGYSLHPG